MSKITRRALLKQTSAALVLAAAPVGVAATALPAEAQPQENSSPLDRLFEKKIEADKRHDQQIEITDAHLEDGTVTEEIWQAQFDACDVVDAIVVEICAYRPVNPVEQDRKARFLLEWTKDTEASDEEVKALLTSMLTHTKGRASA